MDIFMQPVSSSQIQSMGHDPASGTLRVQFHSGATYEYSGVSEEDYRAVVDAESVGAAFNQTIKGGDFGFKRLEEGAQEG